ncbi:hypothetical protein HCY64_15500 [Acinetobacter radioresistens]|uniref:hypothetical protein n=1 Tax=Acinetobacter radioresistens TaxID=40216 RepID=UPI002003A38E|nr:hypothetical protein [Acinetobacter radioresistens]MCK4097428.1 hypothetical protein [Acinetobacter radioresistens]
MKKVLLTALFIGLAGCSNKPELSEEKKQQVINHFKGDKTIKDAVWTSNSMLKVGVINNGSGRDGLAQYVCQELNSLNIHNVRVKVIDIQKLVSTDKWVELGKANCS